MVVFLDTYALFEIDKANPKYKGCGDEGVITTVFNLVELHFVYLRRFGEHEAEAALRAYRKYAVPVGDDVIRSASQFKLTHLKKRMSFADCIGYAAAQLYVVPFVTGDYAFKNMPGVEFVQ